MLDSLTRAGLAAQITGPVLGPEDEGFADECAPFNLSVTHHPYVVVGAANSTDVQVAVRFAAQRQLPVAVLATGHQATVPADDAVLITTHRMARVDIDPAARTAHVTAGVRWQQVIDAAVPFGLAPLNGSSPLVGVVGYTLGGGLSPTMGRAHGWAADHVTSLEAVTADGALRHVDAASEPDLFWALRGGKSNFGVVTAMEFALFPVARLWAGGLFFDGADAAAVLHAYARVTADAPDELSSSIALLRLPALPGVPAFLADRFAVHVRISYLGPAAEAAELVAPLRAAAPVLVDTLGPMPYASFAQIHNDPADPAPFMERTAMLRSLTAEAVEELLAGAGPTADCPAHFVELRHLGGALARSADNAVGHRDAAFALWVVGVGAPDAFTAMNAYADTLLQRMRPWSTGGRYLNFMAAQDTGVSDVSAAYDEADHHRLRSIKRRFDPHNLFRLNHNIPPEEHPMNDDRLQLLTDHAAIADALHRYAAGLDHGDADLLASALTEDAVVDLTPATGRIGLEFPVLKPREAVVGALIPAVGPLDTSHVISNIRATVDGDTARVRCYAMAQHYLPQEGPGPDRTRHALMMNRYDADLTRDGRTWRISRLTIDNAWFEGDETVLLPGD
ncbi:nuclear transport factor 2 family protein [Streptomyces griseoaurantiacus]|uniref:nuclear transport factor 2 family protein n=1 Tax=Streptomyces TaxID=1883 RepID=UPI0029B8DBEE|nr:MULTISPECIES: nuclear transport factor 2 family protein [Streptomyces]MDX3360813.1 nuclear transport factor 2 family protein [Streptomyces sp. ME02-6978.2a]